MHGGLLLVERYEIEALAESGGMAAVYKARDRKEDRVVAIKFVQPQTVHQGRHFARETRMLYELQHPAIVRYLDSGITPGGDLFLVMEWLEGVALTSRLMCGPLGVAESLTVIGRIAAALAYSHDQRVLHRDVKPGNIFLPGSRVDEAKLLDFGLARWAGGTRNTTQPGVRFGTPAYMSPEQVKTAATLTARSDIFSLGCVFYECLTGRPAFAAREIMAVFGKILMAEPPPLRDLAPSVPEPIEALVRGMLAKDPGERPTSAEVVSRIASLGAGLSDAAPAAPVEKRSAITGSEQRVVHGIVAAAGPKFFERGGDPIGAEERAHEGSPVPNSPVPNSPVPNSLDRVTRRLTEMGARFDVLRDGSIIAVFESRVDGTDLESATAVDRAANAARCALRIREELPHAVLALCTGRDVAETEQLVGGVIDSAIESLRRGFGADRPFASRQGSIRVDDMTAFLLRQRFDVRDQPGHGFLLFGEQRSLARNTHNLRSTLFVGRRRELAQLDEMLDECIAEKVAQAIIVTGPPGYGKSRLGREFLARVALRDEAVDVWVAQADSMRTSSVLHVMADAIRYKTGIAASKPPAVCRLVLRDHVDRYVAPEHAGRITAFLGQLLNLPAPLARGADDATLSEARRDPELMGDQVRRACSDLLDAATNAGPVLLVVEDLHWADRATVSLLEWALYHLAERPFMILALARPEVHQRFPVLWNESGVVRIALGQLPRQAAEELVRTMVSGDIADDRMAAIVTRADGNAFYLEELARNAAAGQWTLPPTVAAMVQVRLDTLDPRARRVLRAASVFGGAFWRGGVRALLSEDIDLDAWLPELVLSGMIVPAAASRFSGQPQYAFRHTLIREVVYGTLTESDRQLGHLLAGSWLEEIGEVDDHAIAQHFYHGGQVERALLHYLRAAEYALERGELDTAGALAECAVDCGARGAVLGRLRYIQLEERIWRGKQNEVIELVSAALCDLPRGSREWYDLAGALGTAWGQLGEAGRVERLAAEVWEQRGSDGYRTEWLAAAAKLAQQLFALGCTDYAELLLAEAEAKIGTPERGEPGLAGELYACRAVRAHAVLRAPRIALQEEERCVSSFEASGDSRRACLHRGNLASVMAALGHYDEAENQLERALEQASQLGIEATADGISRQLARVRARRVNPRQPEI